MPFSHINCAQLSAWIDDDKPLTIIDIRDQHSFQNGSIDRAEHIHNDNIEAFMQKTPKDRPLIVCCYHGNSSQGAADYFNQQGFGECYSLDGGYEAWSAHLNSK